MIILHSDGIIALKARKVGGTSLEIALSKYADNDSVITPITQSDEETRQRLGWRGPQNYKQPLHRIGEMGKREILKTGLRGELPKRFWNHISAKETKERVGDDLWNQYFKIAIIRNPFDYMVSSYFWALNTDEQRRNTSFENFVLMRPELLLWNKEIYEIDGNPIIDFMIRYDHLREDLSNIESRFPRLKGLADTFSSLNAKGQHRPKTAQMNDMYKDAPRALSLIYNVCIDDIEKYNFEVPDVG